MSMVSDMGSLRAIDEDGRMNLPETDIFLIVIVNHASSREWGARRTGVFLVSILVQHHLGLFHSGHIVPTTALVRHLLHVACAR